MKFRRILVPIDFSATTLPTVREAFDLARKDGAAVILLTVLDDHFPLPEIFSMDTPNEDYYAAVRDRTISGLKGLIAHHGEGIEVETVVTRGRPPAVIVDFAAREGVDLIVMSTHGTSGLEHALLGSVTERVLRRASCPVLVLRAVAGPA